MYASASFRKDLSKTLVNRPGSVEATRRTPP